MALGDRVCPQSRDLTGIGEKQGWILRERRDGIWAVAVNGIHLSAVKGDEAVIAVGDHDPGNGWLRSPDLERQLRRDEPGICDADRLSDEVGIRPDRADLRDEQEV